MSCRWEDPYGQMIPDSGRLKVIDRKFIISNAQPSDSGNYSCVGENMAGTKKAKLWIVVSGRESYIVYLLDLQLFEVFGYKLSVDNTVHG